MLFVLGFFSVTDCLDGSRQGRRDHKALRYLSVSSSSAAGLPWALRTEGPDGLAAQMGHAAAPSPFRRDGAFSGRLCGLQAARSLWAGPALAEPQSPHRSFQVSFARISGDFNY